MLARARRGDPLANWHFHMLLDDITKKIFRKRKHLMEKAMQKRLTREEAEGIAISGLRFLAGNGEALGRFLALAGIGPQDLRTAANEPGFLAGVLEFYLEDESLLLSFASNENLRPTMIAMARHTLEITAGDDF